MESFGQYLKKEREAREISLDEISKKTRINKKTLQAIESDDIKNLPGDTFIRGFLKAYAKHIGLDETDVLFKYESFYKDDAKPNEEYKIEVIENFFSRKSKIPVAYIIALIIAIVVVIVVYSFNKSTIRGYYTSSAEDEIKENEAVIDYTDEQKPQSDQPPEVIEEAGQEPEVEEAKEEEVQEEEVHEEEVKEDTEEKEEIEAVELEEPRQEAKEEKVKEEALPKEHKIVFRAEGMVWMRIQIDDKKPYEVILKKGEVYKKTAKQKFTLKIGDAGKLRIEFDGKNLGYLGKEKEVLNIMLPGD